MSELSTTTPAPREQLGPEPVPVDVPAAFSEWRHLVARPGGPAVLTDDSCVVLLFTADVPAEALAAALTQHVPPSARLAGVVRQTAWSGLLFDLAGPDLLSVPAGRAPVEAVRAALRLLAEAADESVVLDGHGLVVAHTLDVAGRDAAGLDSLARTVADGLGGYAGGFRVAAVAGLGSLSSSS